MGLSKYLIGQEAIEYIKKEISQQFENDIVMEEIETAFNHHGWFKLKLKYIPNSYTIYFEGEFNCFNIRIIKDDGAFIALSKLIEYNNNLTEQDIRDSLEKLKNILKTKIHFYKIINEKLYQDVNGTYKEINSRKD